MNIRVDLNTPIQDGTEVVFRSPVDCSQVTGLKVYYPGDDGNTASQEFAFADAHGNNVGDIDHLFAENVAVKVILDVTTSMAFVQNADTNAYLESRFDEKAEIDDTVVAKNKTWSSDLIRTTIFDNCRVTHNSVTEYTDQKVGEIIDDVVVTEDKTWSSSMVFNSIKQQTATAKGYTDTKITEVSGKVEALQAEQNKQYELIEDITLDADVTVFERNKDKNGVAYNFSGMRVMVRFAAATGNASVIFLAKNANGTNILYHAGSNSTVGTDARYSVLSVYNDCGLSAYNVVNSTTNGANNQVSMYSAPNGWFKEWTNVASLYIETYASSGTVKIPAGTRIQIYAIRG